jgi:hypothetical protein
MLDVKVKGVVVVVDAGYVEAGEMNEVHAGKRGGLHDRSADESSGTPNCKSHCSSLVGASIERRRGCI